MAARPGRIDENDHEGKWAAGWRAAPARRSGGGRLHLKVCCFVAAALMCNRKNKDEAFGQSRERKSAPDAPPSPQNRLLCPIQLLFRCRAETLQLGLSQMLLGLADPDISGVEEKLFVALILPAVLLSGLSTPNATCLQCVGVCVGGVY